jgi:hypothetical protein
MSEHQIKSRRVGRTIRLDDLEGLSLPAGLSTKDARALLADVRKTLTLSVALRGSYIEFCVSMCGRDRLTALLDALPTAAIAADPAAAEALELDLTTLG